MSPKIIPDIETILSEVPSSPPRPNVTNETLCRFAEAFYWIQNPNGESVAPILAELRHHPGEFPPPPCWKIVCIGVAILTSKGEIEDLACLKGDDEEALIKEVARILSEDKSAPFPEHDVVTFNGRGFDLPVLCARAARYGIQLPYWSSRWHYRYREEPHFDLLDYWSAYGGSPRVSLSQMSKLFGLPGKREGEDGNSVAAMIAEGRLQDVRHYCLSDVVQTAGVYLRTQHFRGKLTRDEYRTAALRLLEACEGAFAPAEALSWISEKTDRRVFLLEDV